MWLKLLKYAIIVAWQIKKNGKLKRWKKIVVKRISKRNNKQIFDTVYRTMATKMPTLMVPLINEVFGTNYRSDRKIEQLRNEFYEKNGKVITDSIFRIGDKLYPIELQSTEDQTMALRMIQYDFAIALNSAKIRRNCGRRFKRQWAARYWNYHRRD